ncbi:MAG: transporter, family, arabinose:H+ symporter [Nocardioidaceae bacterium]|jgi:sugar porter (SP) family MFS transporter|nr:transporter, family, arabinose:H+ symporter [Nocardioidaceae bacterium]
MTVDTVPTDRSGTRRVIALTAATIGVIYGYDLGNISGALLFIPKEFDLSTSQTESITTVVVAGSIVGALLASKLANAIGRKLTMIALSIGYVVFALLGAAATGLVFLDVSRFLLGVTIGLSVVTAPIFIAESAPAATRGRLIVTYQFATVLGIGVAYLVDYALAGGGHWRWMLGLSAAPAALICLVLLRVPDTPRWYAMKGRFEEARATLRVTDPEVDADAEIREMQAALESERGGSVREMVRVPYRRATIFVLVLGFLIQITGINAVVFYTPLIFAKMGYTGNASLLLLPALLQFASLIATTVSLGVVDRIGRRPTLLTGITAMILSNVLLMLVFAGGSINGIRSALGFIGILFFTAGFNFGFGSLVWVYAAESFPARLRTAGASTMLAADLLANLIIAQYFLSALDSLGGVKTFALFLALAVVSWLFIYRFAPETKGRQLEAIHEYWENGGVWPEPADRGSRTA